MMLTPLSALSPSSVYFRRNRMDGGGIDEMHYTPHVLQELMKLPPSKQPEDVKRYVKMLKAQELHHLVIDKKDVAPPDYQSNGVKYNMSHEGRVLVHWTTVPNNYVTSLESPLRILTPRMLNDSDTLDTTSDTLETTYDKRIFDEMVGGVVFSGGLLNKNLNLYIEEWYVDPTGKLNKKSHDMADFIVLDENTHSGEIYLGMGGLNSTPTDDPILCRLNINPDFNFKDGEASPEVKKVGGVDVTISSAPTNILNITSTVVSSLNDSPFILPNNISEVKTRPLWTKDYLYLNTDHKTKQDLVIQTLQKSIHSVLRNFKETFEIKELPCEIAFRKGKRSSKKVKDTSFNNDESARRFNSVLSWSSNSPKATVNQNKSASVDWLTFLANKMSSDAYDDNKDSSNNNELLKYAKEFKLLDTLLERSDILSVSHNLLLKCVGIDQTNGSISLNYGDCYEGALPFDIMITKVDNSNNTNTNNKLDKGDYKVSSPPQSTQPQKFVHLKPLELHMGEVFSNDISNELSKIILDRLAPSMEITHGDHSVYLSTLMNYKPPHLNVSLIYNVTAEGKTMDLVKYNINGPSDSLKDLIHGNDILSNITYSPEGWLFNAKHHDDFLKTHLTRIVERYNTLVSDIREKVVEKSAEWSKVSNESYLNMVNTWLSIEKNTLYTTFIKDVIEIWFDLVDGWLRSGEMNFVDLVSQHNIGNNSAENLKKWKVVGCVGQSSWYAAAHWVLRLISPNHTSNNPNPTWEGHQFNILQRFFEMSPDSARIEFTDVEIEYLMGSIYDSLKHYFYSSLVCLSANPRSYTSPQNLGVLVHDIHKLSSHFGGSGLIDKWLLMVDGLKPLLHNPITLGSLLSEKKISKVIMPTIINNGHGRDDYSLGKQHYATIKKHNTKHNILQSIQNNDDHNHRYGVISDFIPISGDCMIIKQNRIVKKKNPHDDKIIECYSGIGDINNDKNSRKNEGDKNLWYSFRISLPEAKFPHIWNPKQNNNNNKDVYPNFSGVEFNAPTSGTKPYQYHLTMNTPNEYCFITGGVMESKKYYPEGIQSSFIKLPKTNGSDRFSNINYAILTGLNCTYEFPRSGGGQDHSSKFFRDTTIKGREILENLFNELTNLELMHVHHCASTSPSSNNFINDYVSMTPLDFIRYKQIRHRILQLRNVLNLMKKTHHHHHHHQYTLEWHKGHTYEGLKSFVSKEDLTVSQIYHGSKIHFPELKDEMDGLNLTLWLISNNHNGSHLSTTPRLKEDVVEPTLLASYAAEMAKKNYDVILLQESNKVFMDFGEKLRNSVIDHHLTSPMSIAEYISNESLNEFGDTFDRFNQDYGGDIDDDANLLYSTIDTTSMPSYTLSRVCSLIIKDQYEKDLLDEYGNEVNQIHNLYHNDSFMGEMGHINKASLTNDVDVGLFFKGERATCDTFKYEPLTSSFCLPIPEMVKNDGTNLGLTKISKYLSGTYKSVYGHKVDHIIKEKDAGKLPKWLNTATVETLLTSFIKNFVIYKVDDNDEIQQPIEDVLFILQRYYYPLQFSFRQMLAGLSTLENIADRRDDLNHKSTAVNEFNKHFQQEVMNYIMYDRVMLNIETLAGAKFNLIQLYGVWSNTVSKGGDGLSISKNVKDSLKFISILLGNLTRIKYTSLDNLLPSLMKSIKLERKFKVNVECIDTCTNSPFIWDTKSNLSKTNRIIQKQMFNHIMKDRTESIERSHYKYIGNIPFKKWLEPLLELISNQIVYTMISKSRIDDDVVYCIDNIPFMELLQTLETLFLKLEDLYFNYYKSSIPLDLNSLLNIDNNINATSNVTWFKRFGAFGQIPYTKKFRKEYHFNVSQFIEKTILEKTKVFYDQLKAIAAKDNMVNTMLYLERNEDYLTGLYMDYVKIFIVNQNLTQQSQKTDNNGSSGNDDDDNDDDDDDDHQEDVDFISKFMGQFEETYCESLNTITKEYLMYLIFSKCSSIIGQFYDKIVPLFYNNTNSKYTKSMTLQDWYHYSLNTYKLNYFNGSIVDKLNRIAQLSSTTHTVQNNLHYEDLHFLSHLISCKDRPLGEVVVDTSEINRKNKYPHVIYDPHKLSNPLKPLPRWNAGSYLVNDDDTHPFEDWDTLKKKIESSKDFIVHLASKFESHFDSDNDDGFKMAYSKYDLMQLFIRECHIDYDLPLNPSLYNTIVVPSLHTRFKLDVFRHCETSKFKGMQIIPAKETTSNMDLVYLEDWIKTRYLPAIFNNLFIPANKMDVYEQKMNEEWIDNVFPPSTSLLRQILKSDK